MLKKIFLAIDKGLSWGALFAIKVYQATLSPDKGIFSFWLKGRICTHEPHCSEYTKQCVKHYGFFTGMHYGMERVSHCTPRYKKLYDPSTYKVVFFSGAPIGVSFLEALHEDKRFDIVGIVTMPDAPSGRGMKVKENIIKRKSAELKYENGKKVLENENIQTPHSLKLTSKKYKHEAEEFHIRLKNKNPDFIVVVAYGKIIPQSILDIPRFGPINVHGSILPKYRGASPLQSVFLADEKETGLTIMLMNDKLDEGNILDIKKIKLRLDMTVKDLIEEIKIQGPRFLMKVLWEYGKSRIIPKVQDESKMILCGKITKKDGLVDIYTESLKSIYNKWRAYILWPKIYFIHEGKRVIIEKISIEEELYVQFSDSSLIGMFGDNTGKVSSLNPSIEILLVKPEGKKKMTREDFQRGYIK